MNPNHFLRSIGLALALLFLAACATPPLATPLSRDAATSTLSATLSPTAAPTPLASPTPVTIPSPAPSGRRPNIVFVLTDDLDVDSIKVMPRVKSLLIDQGTTFSRSFLNVSLCCPSRTTILRGQYATNTQVFVNTPPDGGFAKVYSQGLEQSTIAVWLQSAGYRNMLAGKYLNGFPERRNPMYIPPGWSEWYSAIKGTAYSEFNYTLNENGKLVTYGDTPGDYGTDVYARHAIDFIQRSAKEGKPFFVYLAPYAPHSPSTPAPRHANLFPDVKAPRSPNYDEADVSDKPGYIRGRPLLTDKQIAQIDADYRKRLQSLQAVDEALGSIVETLQATGQLDNTYIFFTSDNGFHLGNHRLAEGKVAPYEEDIRAPLMVRGPGIPAGRTLDHLVGNVDFAPTFAELGGAKIPDFVDGRSFVPLLRNNPPTPETWRQAYLIQAGRLRTTASLGFVDLDESSPEYTVTDPDLLEPPDMDELLPDTQRALAIPPYRGIRTKDYVYVEYSTGERELYDLAHDPYELTNIAASASPDLIKQLVARLNELFHCSGGTCRTADK